MTSRLIGATLASAALVGGISASASASVIAHWRFEDAPGFTTDSAGTNNALTATNTVTQHTLPSTGAGSAFPDPMPQGGGANAEAASFGNRAGHLRTPYAAAFSAGDFTIESYVHLTTPSTTGATYVAAQWNATNSQRSWGVGVAGSGGDALGGSMTGRELFFAYNTTGSATAANIQSDLTLVTGRDYYVAVAYDRPTSGSNGSVTFYLQDLSTLGALLQSKTVTTDKKVFTVTSGDLDIGTLNNDGGIRWSGLLDEVRFSDETLPEDALLVPEPAALGLLAIGGLLLGRRRR